MKRTISKMGAHLKLDVPALDAVPVDDTEHVDLIVEVTHVADNGVVLHVGHILGHYDIFVASCGNEDIDLLEDILHIGGNLHIGRHSSGPDAIACTLQTLSDIPNCVGRGIVRGNTL